MIDEKKRKRCGLSGEILGVLAVTAANALILFQLLSMGGAFIAESFFTMQNTVLDETQLVRLDQWVFNMSLLVSVGFFVVLFLFLLGERLSYIREIIKGIDALRAGQNDYAVPLEGNNELTGLAEAVNYLAVSRRQMEEKKRRLDEEKEQFIRTLSHDIRTPLTSILSYSELLDANDHCSTEQRDEQIKLIRKKAEQIRDLTDILLDGGKRSPEKFEDARLLMEQLAAEFEETLEEEYAVRTDLKDCPAFGGSFDVQELRRVFDNLISNVQKYADTGKEVALSIRLEEQGIVISQSNAVRERTEKQESYQMGLNSIRRIAHSYGGRVEISEEQGWFKIQIILSEF